MPSLPGTHSGKVSFCMVCIAFSAFSARYHLSRDSWSILIPIVFMSI